LRRAGEAGSAAWADDSSAWSPPLSSKRCVMFKVPFCVVFRSGRRAGRDAKCTRQPAWRRHIGLFVVEGGCRIGIRIPHRYTSFDLPARGATVRAPQCAGTSGFAAPAIASLHGECAVLRQMTYRPARGAALCATRIRGSWHVKLAREEAALAVSNGAGISVRKRHRTVPVQQCHIRGAPRAALHLRSAYPAPLASARSC
jgi:hypothetical protein